MNLVAHLGGLVPFAALGVEPMLGGDGDSGQRTLLAALATLVIIAVVVSIGVAMGRGAKA